MKKEADLNFIINASEILLYGSERYLSLVNMAYFFVRQNDAGKMNKFLTN